MVIRYLNDHRITFFQDMISGGASGILSRTLTAPLDVVKIRSEIGTVESKFGFRKCFTKLYRAEGIRAFWKGNLIGCMKILPYSVLQFSTFHKVKLLLADQQGRLSVPNAVFAGATAGSVATILTYPVELVKTRLIAQNVDKRIAHYKGISHAFLTILKYDGFRGYYHGLSVTLAASIPFTATTFLVYECVDRIWTKPLFLRTLTENLMSGSLAAAVAITLTFPFDVIRRKMQARSINLPNRGGVDVDFDGVADAFRQTVRQNGVLGLWRGLFATLLRIAPYNVIMFMSYEFSKRLFLYSNGYTHSVLQDEPSPGVDQNIELTEVMDIRKEIHLANINSDTIDDVYED